MAGKMLSSSTSSLFSSSSCLFPIIIMILLTIIITVSSSSSIIMMINAQATLTKSCAGGWHNFEDKMCFKHFPIPNQHSLNESLPTPMTFFDALDFCKKEHAATIAPILNLSMMQFLQEQVVGNTTGRKFWNGIYRDERFAQLGEQNWRTVYNRSNSNDEFFFSWDARRRMPQHHDCIAYHIKGDLSRRVVGGNDAMITHPCHSRAEVVCARRPIEDSPWTVTSVNRTDFGSLLTVEGHPLILSVIGHRLPQNIAVQLQTTNYKTFAGLEGEPTHCRQTKPRNPVPMTNGSSTAIFAALNVTRVASTTDPLCNGTCDVALFYFPEPEKLQLQRGFKYSLCFFLPYDYDTPLASEEFRWDFLPNVYLEVAQSQLNFEREVCERRNQLIDVLYFDGAAASDSSRLVPSPWYFSGPLEPRG